MDRQVVKNLFAAVSVTASSFANASPARYRRSTDGFHVEFMREAKGVIQAASMCTPTQFYDLELETCKACEKHCPANDCGQCTIYYDQKSSADITESMDGKLSYNESVDIAQWVCLAVLLLLVLCMVVYLVREMLKKNKGDQIKPPAKNNEATVTQNKAVEQNNRADVGMTASHRGQSRRGDRLGHQETPIGRDGNSEKLAR